MSRTPSQRQLLIRLDQRPEILKYRLYAPYTSWMRAGYDLSQQEHCMSHKEITITTSRQYKVAIYHANMGCRRRIKPSIRSNTPFISERNHENRCRLRRRVNRIIQEGKSSQQIVRIYLRHDLDLLLQVDKLETALQLEKLSTRDNLINNSNIPIFEVTDIPGEGRGLLARVDISMGTQVLCEQPVLTGRPLPLRELETYLATGLNALPKEAQRLFLSLQNNYPGKFLFSYKFKTNALPCGPDSIVGAVYSTICFINHSCIPNVHHSWDTKTKHETIYAIRPIAAGEEITIMYDRGGPLKMPRAFLKDSFGFDCDCRTCSRKPSLLKESDVRRRSIQSLDYAIGDPHCLMSRPAESLRNCQSLLQVLKDEYEGYAGVLNARVYYDAFQICVVHGDQARASASAQKSYEMRVICEGEDSPETQSVRHLTSKPSAHQSSNTYSQKWRTNKAMVPKNLEGARFDEWLFARAN